MLKWSFIFILFSTQAWSQELKVMSWNTFLIPPPWNISKQAERTKAMVEKLPKLDHDIMFFQETFYDKKRDDIVKSLKATHPHVAIPKKGKKLRHIQDSGLMVVSKHPMKILDQVIFKDCMIADCMSSKTAMLVEVTLPSGKQVQMINTHMQASDDPKAREIRKKQFDQIKEMMKKHARPGVAQLLLGDLNVDALNGNEYEESLKHMDMTSTPLEGEIKSSNGFDVKDCFKKPGEPKPQWLDHIWLKDNESGASVKSKRVFEITGEVDDCECPLSDHNPVEAVIEIK